MTSRSGTMTSRILMFSGLAFFALVLIGPVLTNIDGQNGTETGSIFRQIGYLITFGLLVYSVFREGKGSWALRMPLPIVVALGWCWLSLVWAINVDIAFQRLVLTTISTWFAFILVRGAGYERSLDVLRIILVTGLVGNYVMVWLDPAFGIHLAHDTTALYGNWRGLMGHKNFAGAAAAITILIFVFAPGKIHPLARLAILAAAAYFLFRSQSKTSGGMVVIAAVAGWIFVKFDTSIRRFAIPLLMALSAAVFFAGSFFQVKSVHDILDPQLFTGRGHIWFSMLRYIETNWLLGTGFGSFWNIGFESPIYSYGTTGFVRGLSVGHNGYLDLLATIGAPGLALAVFAAIVAPTVKLLTTNISARRGALAVALLVFCVGHNFTESSLFERDSFIGVIMVISVAYSYSWYRDEKRQGSVGSGQDVFAVLRRRAKAASEI
ncbi:O-antigen ligase family protein [Novosphingobium soli]|uniref:O-antigen ligase family protein n=1 Tax=Novosphingobium soli TaxID=574956 RepID=A0ABV6CWI0_9SPHN